MATDEWLTYGGVELVNLSRTTQLAAAMGIDALWTTPESVQWVQDALGGTGYDDVTNAPWYDPGYPASAEFAGVVPLILAGLDDSSLESSTTEYVTDGGNSNKPRNATVSVVASMVLVASTQAGADYGKRWVTRVLRGAGTKMFCSGDEMHYFRFKPSFGDEPEQAHRRDVSLTRGLSVTRKRFSDCAALWWVTFTWTLNDPFEYGTAIDQFELLGGDVEGPGVDTSGSIVLVQESCPVYNYSPIYDPLYPALVPPPTPPNYYPAGWDIADGMTFERFWVRLIPTEPSSLNLVPVLTLTTLTEARMVRVSVWPADVDDDVQCDPLFAAVVAYLPPGVDFVLDGEQKASYAWDGASPLVRRADSLVYAPDATPVNWTAFNDEDGLFVALDVFYDSGEYEGGGDVRVALALVPKSD